VPFTQQLTLSTQYEHKVCPGWNTPPIEEHALDDVTPPLVHVPPVQHMPIEHSLQVPPAIKFPTDAGH
jgi:hypothetical protein